MKHRRPRVLIGLASVAIALLGTAMPASADPKPWSVEARHGPAFTYSATLDEATWLSVDISPDSRTLVFDILGDLYTMPLQGGTAKQITSGAGYDAQPRFSPDGSRILFVSDRTGANDLWIANKDGSGAQRLTRATDLTLMSPAWSRDGASVYALALDDRSADDRFELVRFGLADGAMVRMVDRKRAPLGPTLSPDGRSLYFTTMADGGIDRLDLASGKSEPVVRGYGGASRPAVSPDGHWIAFGRRIGGEVRMVLRDLSTGAEHLSDVRFDWDQQDNPDSDVDLLPGYAFTPDSAALIYSANGKLRRFDIASGQAAIIPFQADIDPRIQHRWTVTNRISDAPVKLRMLRWTHESPDGKTLFFAAAGKIYRYDIRTATARRIVEGGGLEYSPAVSPDGRWLVYVGWTDAGAAHIYRTPVERFAPERLTTQAGHYEHLSWSPDGGKLVYLKSSGGELRGEPNLIEAIGKTVEWIEPTRPATTHVVAKLGSRGDRRQEMRPSFSGDGSRIYITETPERRKPTTLFSLALDGSDRRAIARFRFADDVMPSPDGKWIAFTEQFEAYVAPFPAADAGLVDIDPRQPESARRLSSSGAYFLNWVDRGRSISWGWGPSYYKVHAELKSGPPRAVQIAVSEPRMGGTGQVLLRGARIVTMGSAGVIDRGEILVENNRIRQVGVIGSIGVGSEVKVVDVTGKTIIPGIVDVHNHYRQGRNAELFPEMDWGYVTQLAYGVTTVRDPSARSQSIFTQAEMMATGRSWGPRIFSTGEPIYYDETAFARPPQSLEEMRLNVRRLKALGASAIKLYTLRRREQRQWLLQAAREEGLIAIPEGAQKIFFDITLLMDGYSTLEHAIKTAPLHADMLGLFKVTGTPLVPTLTVGPGGAAEEYFYGKGGVAEDKKLLRFVPRTEVAPHDALRSVRPEGDYYFKHLARSSTDVLRAGGRLALGAHGNLEGLGVHWEMWAMADGGLTPLETLRAATIGSAEAMGLQHEIGSIEAGKLADLAILGTNPLEDIRNTNSVRLVMKGGVMWNADTMDQIWPQTRSFPGFYWRRQK